MTRIVAGNLKGRNLKVPDSVTRPTSSKVREAMFSSLEHHIGSFEDLSVLDLYAGSGALGIEALSRGAKALTLVESDRRAVKILKGNCEDISEVVTIKKMNVGTYVSYPSDGVTFDLVFFDPPYSVVDAVVEEQVEALALNGWLAPKATIVVERDKKSTLTWPAGFTGSDPKPYGDTMVWYGQWSGN